MRKSDWAKWLIVIPAMLGIVLVTYVRYTTDIWGFGAFICQLIAILEVAYGMRIAMLAQSRKKSYRLTPEERHEYAQYLYEKQYQRYPAVANQMLLVMARMSILLDNYERATHPPVRRSTSCTAAIWFTLFAAMKTCISSMMRRTSLQLRFTTALRMHTCITSRMMLSAWLTAKGSWW